MCTLYTVEGMKRGGTSVGVELTSEEKRVQDRQLMKQDKDISD